MTGAEGGEEREAEGEGGREVWVQVIVNHLKDLIF